jgi:cellulose biosynthesis protein BcsQ
VEEAEKQAANAASREKEVRGQLDAATAAQHESERLAKASKSEIERLSAELSRAKECIEEQRQSLEAHQGRIKSVAAHNGRVWLTPPLTKPPEFVPLAERRTRIISILNLKGGVGKTTLTANLGGYLADCHEKWVLLLDLDHQRSLTQLMLSTKKRQTAANDGNTIQDFLLSTRTGKELRKAALHLEAEGLSRCWLLGNSDAEPGFGTEHNLDDVEMSLLARWLVNPTEPDVRYLLRPALHSREIQERFGYVLIDCPPRLTTACVSALAASDFVLIPTEAEQVSARSVPHLLRRLRELRNEKILPELRILGIVANMVSAEVDKSTSLEAKVLRETEGLAKAAWGESVRVLAAKIRESDTYATAQRDIDGKGLSLPGVGRVREQYKKLTEEIEGLIT